MTTATANIINRYFDARDAFNAHFDICRTCGCGGRLCAAGNRLHTIAATLNNSINR